MQTLHFYQKKITKKVVISVNVWLLFLSTVFGEKIARGNLYLYTHPRDLGATPFPFHQFITSLHASPSRITHSLMMEAKIGTENATGNA